MRLSLSLIIVTIMSTLIGCQNPGGLLGIQEHSRYDGSHPVAGPGPGVIPPTQTPLPQMPLLPPGVNSAAPSARIPATPSMYYPMTLRYDSPVAGVETGNGMPVAPNPVIPSPALGNISASAATPNRSPQISLSQIDFNGPESLIIYYDAKVPGAFDSEPLVCPATLEVAQGNVYRLKLSNIPGRPGRELYPTLEVAPTNPKTFAYLVSCSIPISFTDNDFDQALTGNLITKVIYLPNREFQSLATAGMAGAIVNTDLEPGVDPITEAQNRGSILAIIRMGNKDLRLTRNELKRREAVIASAPSGMPPNFAIPTEHIYSSMPGSRISGWDMPPYGTPMTKTTTGVPGPPQLPLAMDSGYRYPIIYAEPIPVPPSVRAYPPNGGTTPYGYPAPPPTNPYFQTPTNGYPHTPSPAAMNPNPTINPRIR